MLKLRLPLPLQAGLRTMPSLFSSYSDSNLNVVEYGQFDYVAPLHPVPSSSQGEVQRTLEVVESVQPAPPSEGGELQGTLDVVEPIQPPLLQWRGELRGTPDVVKNVQPAPPPVGVELQGTYFPSPVETIPCLVGR